MKQFTINTPSGAYAVVCGHGISARAGALLEAMESISTVFLVSSQNVWRCCGRHLESSLRRTHGTNSILMDDRESAKRLAAVEKICRSLAKGGADRNSVVVALGGGVVGDVAGFAAASYARGIRLVQVPTTLLAQVDSSIGGKTGVNLPEGKNLVGAFHQPRLVITDPKFLKTLPARQYRAGLYEAIKYGIIGDEMLFRFLERRLRDVLQQHPSGLGWVLERCIRAKAEVVSADERERGLREVLNFGHTFAHALETATRYKTILHGEAVGWGMMAAAHLSVRMKMLAPAEEARIANLVRGVGPLPKLPSIKPSRMLELMLADKKARGGRLRMVLARKVGAVETVEDVPQDLVLSAWQDIAAGGNR